MTLQDQLTEAQAALHRLMCGQAVSVFIDQSGEQVRYSVADAAKLRSYIAELQGQISAAQPVKSIVFQTSKGLCP